MKVLGRHGAHEDHGEHHHHVDPVKRLQRVEGLFDVLVITLVVILGGAMAWGLLTATGSAPWME